MEIVQAGYIGLFENGASELQLNQYSPCRVYSADKSSSKVGLKRGVSQNTDLQIFLVTRLYTLWVSAYLFCVHLQYDSPPKPDRESVPTKANAESNQFAG